MRGQCRLLLTTLWHHCLPSEVGTKPSCVYVGCCPERSRKRAFVLLLQGRDNVKRNGLETELLTFDLILTFVSIRPRRHLISRSGLCVNAIRTKMCPSTSTVLTAKSPETDQAG